MTVFDIVVVTVAILVILGWHLSYTAARLHRLHTRVEGALAALDAQLVRRAEAALELANGGLLDPATSLILADAAIDCLDASADEMTSGDWTEGNLAQRETLESALTDTIGHALGFQGPRPWPWDGVGDDQAREGLDDDVDVGVQLHTRLRDTGRRVQLARRFYNDAVTDVQRLRGRWTVRTLHLAGHAALPRSAVFDDGT